jgi:hypothetical protein
MRDEGTRRYITVRSLITALQVMPPSLKLAVEENGVLLRLTPDGACLSFEVPVKSEIEE